MIDAMILQEQIPEIDLLAISVQEVREIGMQLSPKVEDAILAIINKIHELIKQIKS